MHKPDRKIAKADIILLSITLIWGSTFVIVKNALHFISPLLFQGIRFGIASVIVGLFTWKHIRAAKIEAVKQGMILGIFLGVGFALQTIGLQVTTASKSAFITGFMVVLVPIFQLVIEKRRPTRGNVVGVFFVAIGLYLLTSPAGSQVNTGDVLTLGAAIIFAVYIVYLDIYTKESFPREIVFYQMLVTSVLGFIFAPLLENSFIIPDSSMLLALLYTAIFASAMNTFLQSKYQRDSSPVRAAVIFAMEPVFAAVLAVLMLHEAFTAASFLGAGMIITGLLISELT